MQSNTEDFLQSVALLVEGGTGAYVCDYSFTTAKGKDTILSTYLRWEGGNFAIFPQFIVFRHAMQGLALVLVIGCLIATPLVVLIQVENWFIAGAALFATLSATTFALFLLIRMNDSAQLVRHLVVQNICLRCMINPLVGAAGAAFIFALPFLTAQAGHVPLQLEGVQFPWVLLIRALVVGLIQGVMYIGLITTDWLRNDVQTQVLGMKLKHTDEIVADPVSPTSPSHLHMRIASLRDASLYMTDEISDAVDPRDQELDRFCTVHLGQVWAAATFEYCLQLFYQLNLMTLQPGKGVMSFCRGTIEVFSRSVFGVDTSGWTSFQIERVVMGIPIVNEVFVALIVYPYPTMISKFLVFVLVAWYVRSLGFVWVEEVAAIKLTGIQLKAALTWVVVLCHVFWWFQVADLV